MCPILKKYQSYFMSWVLHLYIIMSKFENMLLISVCKDCLANNTLISMCNKETTNCLCKERYTGRVCGKCMQNYDGYPKCDKCSDEYFGYPLCEGMS